MRGDGQRDQDQDPAEYSARNRAEGHSEDRPDREAAPDRKATWTSESGASSGVDTESDSSPPPQRDIVTRQRNTIKEMKTELREMGAEKQRLRERAEQLEGELSKLKQAPNFVGTVEDVIGEEVVVRQHGSNQEVVTEVTADRADDLAVGDRVSLNKQLNIIGTLPSGTNAETQSMQIDTAPDVSYADIGGVDSQLRELCEAVELPLTDPEQFDRIGIDPPAGVLLHGPPGTGKTMLAKAIAAETDATFIRLAGSELVRKFVGEGARLVREVFTAARENGPTVLFIDEIDAIGGERSADGASGDGEVQRTLLQLLAELDGFGARGDVRVIGATNRRDMLDEALLRPGRFDRLVEVPAPEAAGRKEIFKIHTAPMTTQSLDYDALAALDDSLTGAQIEAICTEAGMAAIRESRDAVTMDDFQAAADKVLDNASDDPTTRTADDRAGFV